MTQQRDNTVTYVKAIGIILMVLGHVLTSDMVVGRAIFTFHMPLFFLMSGYCFKEKYLDDTKQFVVRKIKGIYVPFVLFSLPFLAMHNVFCHWNIYDPDWLYGWKDFAWHTSRIVTRMSHNEGLLGTFWFLKELFWGNLIFYATLKLAKRLKGLMGERMNGLSPEWVTVIGLFVLTEIACIFHLRIPYFTVTQTSTYAAFFVAFGYLWKKCDWPTNRWWLMIIGVVSVITEALLENGIGMNTQTPMSLLYYTIPAITGTMVVFEVSRYINTRLHGVSKSLMLFTGEHTLSVMALHFSTFKMVSLGYILVCGLSIERLVDFPVIRELASTGLGLILYTFVGIILPLSLSWIWIYIKPKIYFL